MAAPLSEGSPRWLRALRFLDVLEDSDPSKLSWTKIGVAVSTLLSVLTGTTAAIQAAVGNLAATPFEAFATAIGLHVVTKGAHEVKRWTERGG